MKRKVFSTHYKYISDNDREVLMYKGDQIPGGRYVVFILKGYKFDDYVLFDSGDRAFYDNVVFGYNDNPNSEFIGYDAEGFEVTVRKTYKAKIFEMVPEIFDIMDDYIAEKLID